MNARAYRHHLGVTRLLLINASIGAIAVGAIVYGLVWPMLTTLADVLAHVAPVIGAH